MATPSKDAIIAIVDRAGQILGVRVEEDVQSAFAGRPQDLVFAIDGAVAKARTAAFFSNSEAPLTSRTIRFISQSTMTQREVESNPNINDINSPLRGPGFVAPIGVGGHFPPEVRNTPLVDLFRIEHQSRDSALHPGLDGMKGFGGDDLTLNRRFNVDPAFVSTAAQDYMKLFPESYGTQSGLLPTAQSRGIATLPGGIPLYRPMIIAGKPTPILIGGVGVANIMFVVEGSITDEAKTNSACSSPGKTALQRLSKASNTSRPEGPWALRANSKGSMPRRFWKPNSSPFLPPVALPSVRTTVR